MAGYKKAPSVPESGIPSLGDLFKSKVLPPNEHVRRCREDFEYFLENVVRDKEGRPLRLKPFHRLVARMMVNRRRALVFMPRGFGKSSIAVAYACWKVGNDRDVRILIASKGADLAEERLRQIEQLLRQSDYVEVFGDLVPSTRSTIWTATQKAVIGRSESAQHLTFYVVGIGGQVAGRRADIVLCDDVIDQKNAITEIQRGHASDWFWKELEPVLEPITGQWICVATPWSHNDLNAEIQQRWKDLEDFEFLKVQAISQNEMGDWVSTWPERFPTKELLLKRQITPLEFTSQYMCEPIDTTMSFLQREWLRPVIIGEETEPWDQLPDILQIYFGVDPTWSGRKAADQFALAVLGIHPERREGYLLDIMHAQLSPTEAMHMVEEVALKWRPLLVFFETNAAQVYLEEQYIKETNLPIYGVKAVGPKEERFKAMSVHFTSGRFRVASYRDQLGNIQPMPNLEPFVYEWITFPRGEHDDILDSVEKALLGAAFGIEPAETVISQEQIARAQQTIPDNQNQCAACGRQVDFLYEFERYLICDECAARARRNSPNDQYRLRQGLGMPGLRRY